VSWQQRRVGIARGRATRSVKATLRAVFRKKEMSNGDKKQAFFSTPKNLRRGPST
jgi:hypothetical protein